MTTHLDNIAVLSDSYKFLHYSMYPEGTEGVYSYFEARKGATFDETVFFGLQYYLKKYLEGVVVTPEKVAFAETLAAAHFGNGEWFNKAGWQHIIDHHGGRLPLRIKAVPEGTPVPISNVMMTVENTDPAAFWLTNYVETILTHVWSASTVATLSRHVKKMLARYLEETADSSDGLGFMLHDFGFRGVSSVESAAFSGAGHLVNFMGTDTVAAIVCAMTYYDADVCAFSVPATEHSIMTSLGPEDEHEVIERLLDKFPTGILSVVGDSYDIYGTTADLVGGAFKDRIVERDGVYVVRPDSGEPVSTVLKLLDILHEKFGTTVNGKGFKVLHPKVRIIWAGALRTSSSAWAAVFCRRSTATRSASPSRAAPRSVMACGTTSGRTRSTRARPRNAAGWRWRRSTVCTAQSPKAKPEQTCLRPCSRTARSSAATPSTRCAPTQRCERKVQRFTVHRSIEVGPSHPLISRGGRGFFRTTY
jgi:nicotinamide phosphoribosyltransferase